MDGDVVVDDSFVCVLAFLRLAVIFYVNVCALLDLGACCCGTNIRLGHARDLPFPQTRHFIASRMQVAHSV